MKTKLYTLFISLCTLLTVSCLLSISASAEVIGRVDWVTDTYLEGYAWDTEVPVCLPVTIQITKEGSAEPVQTLSVTADQFRDDLPAFSNDSGHHSFHIPMNWSLLGDGNYQVALYYMDNMLFEPVSYTYMTADEAIIDSPADTSVEMTAEAAEAPETPAAEPAAETLSAENTASKQSLGSFRLTGYCPCYRCSEGWGRHTSTGTIAKANHTIAVDPHVIPYGSKVMINGVIYTAEDRGGGVKGKHIDIFFDTHAETRRQGTTLSEVFLIA